MPGSPRVSGHAERLAALEMIGPRAERPVAVTLGADKGYDTADFVMELREIDVTPHVAQNTSGRTSAINRRTTRHGGYAVSQRIRKRIREGFGWLKTIAGLKKTRYRGIEKKSAGPSPSPSWPTIWSGYPSSWLKCHEPEHAHQFIQPSRSSARHFKPARGSATSSTAC